jgi:hypothetical protein
MDLHTVPLKSNFFPLVKVGDSVIVGKPIAQEKSDREQVVNIAQQLNISLKKVKNVLKKNPGDPIHKGDIIAEKKGLLGFDNAAVISNVEGIVFRYERSTGNLVIRLGGDPIDSETIISPVAGTIALCDNDKIVIHVHKEETQETEGTKETDGVTETEEIAAFVQEDSGEPKGEILVDSVGNSSEPRAAFATKGYGEPREGELFVLEGSLYDLTGEATGKIVLGEKFTREILMKGIGIGVVGFIGGEINEEDLDFFEQRQSRTPIIQVDGDTINRLKYWEGRKMRLDGGERVISLVLDK